MAFNAKVSIALITYNQEKFVSRTIESILNQSYQNFELIIGSIKRSHYTKPPTLKNDEIKDNTGS